VLFNEDIRAYIEAALSPAKVSEIKLNKEAQKAEVIVDDDQLSLAIGKHGQNVRLASRLIGWELDIRTKSTAAKEEKQPEDKKEELVEQKPKKKTKKEASDLEKLKGVGEKTLKSLKEAGFSSIDDIAKSKIEDLIKIKGLGEKKAQKLIAEAKKAE